MSFAPETTDDNVVVPTGNLERLLAMLRFRRPHQSKAEAVFRHTFLPKEAQPLKAHNGTEIFAWIHTILDAEGKSPDIMFSSHLDTVHSNGGKQKVQYDAEMFFIWKEDGEPLGADDAAGVWIMLEMIEAGVPGHYVFHRGEEKGGIGSDAISRHYATWLKSIRHAVAFDRRGTDDVITRQRGGKCASDEFALALADKLNAYGMDYKPCNGGIFTDTANYTDIVPECTNLSVGYDNEHTGKETLDVWHLLMLRSAACDPATWADLPVHREPGDTGSTSTWWSGGGDWRKAYGWKDDDDDHGFAYNSHGRSIGKPGIKSTAAVVQFPRSAYTAGRVIDTSYLDDEDDIPGTGDSHLAEAMYSFTLQEMRGLDYDSLVEAVYEADIDDVVDVLWRALHREH